MPMPCRRQGDGDDEGMEHCSEQDDGFDMKKIPSPLSSRKSSKKSQSGQTLIEDGHMDLDADLSMSSSRLTESLVLEDEEDEDDRPTQPAKKIKVSRKRFSQGTSSFGDVLDQIEEEENTGAGIQSFSGSGLRIYAQRVCERVESKGSTSYNQLVHELCGGTGDPVEGAPEIPGQENIRRRVYDALNVLEALGVISMDNKDIRWIGIQESTVINEISRRIAISVLQTGGGGEPPEHPGDDESEEPEDDEMEIEKLQREVEALRMGNELELAQFKDQAAKHVQVLNLVKRNKRREEKEQEKEERRRQRKEEKRAARALAATSSGADQDMTDVGPQGCSDDHSEEPQAPRQRRSSRQPSETPSVSRRRIRSNTDAAMAEVDDSEEAALRKEQERKERRERKEKRAQRRQQREAQNVQLPFVMVQMDGYTGQSSDSEGGISVVRRVREEPKSRSSGKSKRSGQSTATVEISIPQQEELSIISDTEVLAELGLDSVPMEQLRSCFSVEAIQTIAPGVDVNSHGLVSMRGGHERALLHRADSSRQ
ncbi:hypothetical protein BGZ83_010812 [Gryganskiella cystojenkinii]|nr:hypothetical protein BGZ83_010812 [Gryganskiella cystojenkinii]